MKKFINFIKIYLITLNKEKKKQYLIFSGVFIFIIFIVLFFGFFNKKEIQNLDNPIGITQTGNVLIENSGSFEFEKKENGLLSKIVEIEKYQIEKNEDLLKKIEKKEDILLIIDYIYNLKTISKNDIEVFNKYLLENKLELNFNCKENICTLSEQLNYLIELENIKLKLNKIKEISKNSNIEYSKLTLSNLNKNLNSEYLCSNKNTYLEKIKEIKELKIKKISNIKIEISNFKNLINESKYFQSLKFELNSLIQKDSNILTYEELRKMKLSKNLSSFSIFLGDEKFDKEYYEKNGIYYEKEFIDNITNNLKNDYYKITNSTKFSIITQKGFSETNKGKIEIANPVLLMPELGFENGFTYLFLNFGKENCNFFNLNFDKKISNSDLIKIILKEYENSSNKILNGNYEKEDLIKVNYIEKLFNLFTLK